MRVFVGEGSRYGQADIEAGSEAGSIRGVGKRRREPAERDRRLEKLAIEALTVLGERDATMAATEQRAGAASQAMITDESLTVSDAVQRVCRSKIGHREAARLRQLTAQAQQRLARE
jgi:hypothetical protein